MFCKLINRIRLKTELIKCNFVDIKIYNPKFILRNYENYIAISAKWKQTEEKWKIWEIKK